MEGGSGGNWKDPEVVVEVERVVPREVSVRVSWALATDPCFSSLTEPEREAVEDWAQRCKEMRTSEIRSFILDP